MPDSVKTILITGATSGFGKAIAEKSARQGWRLIITGRRQEKLDALCSSLKKKYGTEVLALCFDVRQQAEVDKQIDGLPHAWQHIDVLVNNAGLASGLDHIQNGLLDDWEKMIDTNVKGLLYVTRAVLPFMLKQKAGHIIHIGSTAGKEVYEKGNVYCATKHAVDALSKAMRIDLLHEGIKVSQVCPGAAETEFSLVRFHGDAERAANVYKGFQPLQAEDVAEVVHFIIQLPKHVCINDVVLTSLAQANSQHIKREKS